MTMSVKEESSDTIIGAPKVFKLPGQRFATPAPANGDRVFYESLLEQKPDSAMAQEWCVAYGTLDHKKALALLAIIEKRKATPVVSPKKATPVKASRPAPAAKKPPAKKASSKK